MTMTQAATPAEKPVWHHRSPTARLILWAFWLITVALFVWCWNVMTERTMWVFVYDAPTAAADLATRAFPPRWSYMAQLWKPLWDTINIATLGTLLGIIMAVPLAFLAADNTTPSRLILRPIALFCIVATRSINSLIWALLLVSILGPGLLAGILAIAFRSIGFIGKLLYEAIEETDINQVEAVTATVRRRFSTTGSCRRSCPLSTASRCSVGISTSARALSSALSAQAESGRSCKPR